MNENMSENTRARDFYLRSDGIPGIHLHGTLTNPLFLKLQTAW